MQNIGYGEGSSPAGSTKARLMRRTTNCDTSYVLGTVDLRNSCSNERKGAFPG